MGRKDKGEKKKRPRRPRGTGSIVERADGRVQGKYRVDGKEHYVYADTYAECNRLLIAAIRDAKQGNQPVKTADYLNRWLNKKKKIGYKANSYDQRSRAIRNYIIPAFGHLPLHKIRQEQVQDWVAQMNTALAPATVVSYHSILSAALADAVRAKIIPENPCLGVTLPVVKKQEQTVLSVSQLSLVLEKLEGKSIYGIIAMAALMGLRKGELLSLRWSDINFTNNTIYIHRNVARVTGRFVEDSTKTEASTARLPLIPGVRKILIAHKSKQNDAIINAGPDWQSNDLVFPGKKGGYRYAPQLDIPFKRALRLAGLPDMKFHELRHSTASILAEMGVHPKIVQEIMRHSSITQTMDTYSHLFPGTHDDAMARMNEAFEDAMLETRGDDEANKEAN